MRFKISLVAVFACLAAALPAWAEDADDAPGPTPRERAFAERVDTIHERSARGGTLRERLAFSGYLDVDERAAPLLRERIRLEELVDSARGENDPVVLQLLLHRCLTARSRGQCDTVAVARRWTDVDGLNQVAWLGLAAALQVAGDVAGERAAALRAAAAPAWRSGYTTVWRALAGDLPRGLAPAERLALLSQRGAAASLVQLDIGMSLNRLCKVDEPDTRRACTALIETMARDGETLMEATLVSMIARRGNFDAQRLREFQRRSDALHWAVMQGIPREATLFEIDDTPSVRAELARIDAFLLIGEIRYAERQLGALSVSEVEAAARYVATLPPGAGKLRIERVTPFVSAGSTRSTAASP